MNTIQKLSELLASNYTLYIKTQNFHWNVTGPAFFELHSMLEEQYTALAKSNDDIAERIRALGEFAPGSCKQFLELSFIQEAKGNSSAKEMIEELLENHKKMVSAMKELTQEADDGTQDLLSPLIANHEKTTWMLHSYLQ